MNLYRLLLSYTHADGTSVELIGWWPSIAAAGRTARLRGAVEYRTTVLSEPIGIAP